jgi:hypothetical protein
MGMDDIDWDRYRVDSRAQSQSGAGYTRLGDPTNWGRERAFTLVKGATGFDRSDAMVRAQCTDGYARAWYLTGTLEVSDVLFASVPPDVIWNVQLEITQGVGQAVIVQRLSVRRMIAIATSVYDPTPLGTVRRSYPWVVSGGIFAQAISVRTLSLYTGEGPGPDEAFRIAMALGPIAAGDGV